jgi:copper chaperone CopZ
VRKISFVVEQAGCASCAERVHRALAPLADVQSVDVDEGDDSAAVQVSVVTNLSEDDVNRVLADASDSSGHEYRIRDGSWIART